MKFSVVTFGCKVNQYESQMMRELLGEFHEEAKPGQRADVVLVNTCSVTDKADRQCRQALRRARKRNPGATIVAAGCHARRPGVDLVGDGLADSVVAAPTPAALFAAFNLKPAVAPRAIRITGFAGHTRAFVKVQDGCDRKCSFCVVPLIRGASVSRPLPDIADEVRILVAGGTPEIVLCGVRLNAYRDPGASGAGAGRALLATGANGDGAGRALLATGASGAGGGGRLVALLETLLAIPGLNRLRLSSLYPGDLEQGLLEIVAGHPKVCRHLHLPVQSGSDRILKEMRRGYTAGDVRELTGKARELCPEIGLTADILVGFPGETEGDFRETTGLIRDCGFHRLHLFPFSPRPGTPAAFLPVIPSGIVAARMEILRGLDRDIRGSALARLAGRETEVVVENREPGGWWRGTTGEYHSVRFLGQGVRAGAVARVKITGMDGMVLTGTCLPSPAGSVVGGA